MADLSDGRAVVTLKPITLLTQEALPLYIAGIDITVEHKSLDEPRHDTKPFRQAVGVDDVKEAKTIAQQRMATAAADVILQAIIDFLTSN